jgi:16S rRNA (cytosine1402-N4)-methyltransferase
VLLTEAVELLAPREGAVIVDCTLGGGGHSEALLERGATVYAIDRDPRARAASVERLVRFGTRFHPLAGNFGEAASLLHAAGVEQVDGLLADLGVSSPQLDDATRGFSFSRPGPLDMRMGPDTETLAEYLQRADEREIGDAIRDHGEEPHARRIAKAIKAGTFADTAALAEAIGRAIPRGAWPKHIHPATRTFQALRIAVNRELDALDQLLAQLPALIRTGGRAAMISFHSLEDRRVKDAFRALESRCVCPPGLPVCTCGRPGDFALLTKRAVTAPEAELEINPRSRSAKLRGVERMR